MLVITGNTYQTQEGDMLDAICIAHYGGWSRDILKVVWEANRWLLHLHLKLPAGKILILPKITADKTEIAISAPLWKDSPAFSLVNGKYSARKDNVRPLSRPNEYDDRTLEEYLVDYRRSKLLLRERENGQGRVVMEQNSQPTNGFVENQNNEVYRYSPQTGFIGVDRFQLRATDGFDEDIDVVEIVVMPGNTMARYEMFPASRPILETTKLMFGAIKPLILDTVLVHIARADAGTVSQSHNPALSSGSYVDVNVLKRATNGSVIPWGTVRRLHDLNRIAEIIPINGKILAKDESLILQVKSLKGSVFGLFCDVYSTLQ